MRAIVFYHGRCAASGQVLTPARPRLPQDGRVKTEHPRPTSPAEAAAPNGRMLQSLEPSSDESVEPSFDGLVRVASTEALVQSSGITSYLPDAFFETLRSIKFITGAVSTFSITGFTRSSDGTVRHGGTLNARAHAHPPRFLSPCRLPCRATRPRCPTLSWRASSLHPS